MKKLFSSLLVGAVLATCAALSASPAQASDSCIGTPERGDYTVTCIDGVWYEIVERGVERRCVAPYDHVGFPWSDQPYKYCLFYPFGRSAMAPKRLTRNPCPQTPGIPENGVYGVAGTRGSMGDRFWNESSPDNRLSSPGAGNNEVYYVCSQGYSRGYGTGKYFWKDCPAGFDVRVTPGRRVDGYSRTVGDQHFCLRQALITFPTPTPDAGSGTPPGSATPTPVPTAVPTPVGGVGGGCGKFKPGVDLCSTSKAEWTTCEADWKVTAGSDADQDRFADVFAGSGLVESVEVPGLPAGQDFVAYLWIKPVGGSDFTLADRKGFTCSASGVPTPVPTVAVPVVPPAATTPLPTPTPDPGLVYPGPFESFFVDNLKEVIFPFGFGAFGPGSAPTGATSSDTTKPDVEPEAGADVPDAEPGAADPEADSGTDAEPTVTPKPVAAPGSVVVPGLGQKLCAGDTFRFRGGLGEWKVTVGTVADIDKYMHVDVGVVGAGSNGELKISGVPAGSKPRVIVWNRAPGEKAYGAVSVTPYVCSK